MQGIKTKCDFCNKLAKYDTKTKFGPWANVCQEHFDKYSTQEDGLHSRLVPKPLEVKTCYICDETKDITEFYGYTDANGYKRHRNECKACNLAQRKLNAFRKSKKEAANGAK